MRGKRRGYIKRYMVYNLKEKAGSICICLCFLFGFVGGMFLPGSLSGQTVELLMSLCSVSMEESTFVQLFSTAFLGMTGLLLYWFLCGFHAFGQVFSGAAVVLQGIGFGVMGSFIYVTGAQSVNMYYSLVLIPRMLIWLVIAVASVKQSVMMSMSFLGVVFPQIKCKGLAVHHYAARFVLLLFGAVGYGALDAILQKVYYAFI